MSEEQCYKTVAELFEKYKDNEYMIQRLINHVTSILPNTLETEQVNYEKRIVRQNFLSNEQQSFIQVFLNKNRYFYMNNNLTFCSYLLNKFHPNSFELLAYDH